MLPGEGVHSQGFIILWLYLVLIYPHLIWSRYGVVAKWKYPWSNLCCGAKESHTVCNISQSTQSGFVSQISLGIISIHIYSGFGSVSVLTKENVHKFAVAIPFGLSAPRNASRLILSCRIWNMGLKYDYLCIQWTWKGIIKPWSYSKLYTKDNNVWCLWMYPAFGCWHLRMWGLKKNKKSNWSIYHIKKVSYMCLFTNISFLFSFRTISHLLRVLLQSYYNPNGPVKKRKKYVFFVQVEG